ncbi:hypothetical protein CQS02_00100 [Elizabethkingia miricola]|nr:hypothetical protein CQS02_00100 [Elizabethkingia miricola]
MESGAKEVDSVVQKYTGAQLAKQNQDFINSKLTTQQKIKDLRTPSGGGNGSSKILGDGALTVSPVIFSGKQKDGMRSYEMQAVNYFVEGNTNAGKESRVGISAYWNPNGGKDGKGAVNFGINLPSKDGKNVVMENANLSRVLQILASNKVKDPNTILSGMANAVINNPNIINYQNKPIRWNDNFNVDFSPIKPKSNYTYNYNLSGGLLKELQK